MEETINAKEQLKISLPIALEDLINVLMTLVDTIIMKISLDEAILKIIFYKILPILLLGIYIVMSATYYYAIIRGLRDFKFLAKRNFVSSLIKIIVATILAYTPLGIIGVWVSYLIYCILQKYMSKNRVKQLI